MKTIIAGSRWFSNAPQIKAILDHAVSDWNMAVTEVVSGGARGVDSVGELWAAERGLPVFRFPADWDAHGKSAGPIRNRQMADYADALIAIWDGSSRGTKHMIEEARRRNMPMVVLIFNEGAKSSLQQGTLK